ncbi:hypothetical protein JBKA6_0785 [Ichthyobacterium seriolicida]|uniref:Uncharacterized protein n=1 Tax=Ichthyobacterium seriolicida TaxID=242600 RepID=A0A1J1E645_9FLAO|nr:hypothetical protein JBKA6_0785 [Ichthyobacterium seriolicida]
MKKSIEFISPLEIFDIDAIYIVISFKQKKAASVLRQLPLRLSTFKKISVF